MREEAEHMQEQNGPDYKKELMTDIIKSAHAGQFRNNGRVPYWYHCQNVAQIVEGAIITSNELSKDVPLTVDMYLAAQGHDLYEDTAIQPQQVREQFGERVDQFISYLTNENGDQDRSAYVEKIRNAPEEVRLIKLGDSIDNTLGVAYGIHDLGVTWTEGFFLPIISEIRDTLRQTSFTKYSNTATILMGQLEFAYQRLLQNLQKFKDEKSMENDSSSNTSQSGQKPTSAINQNFLPGNQHFWEITRKNERYMEERRQELTRVKAEAGDKEPFSMPAFANMYDITNDQGELSITPELTERYEMEYYLDQPDIKNLKDFARHRERMDKNDAG